MKRSASIALVKTNNTDPLASALPPVPSHRNKKDPPVIKNSIARTNFYPSFKDEPKENKKDNDV